MVPPPGSITCWIHQLKSGNPEAAQPLWERYYQNLTALARKKLHRAQRRAADEEDVALSAFDSFCRGAAQGRFPRLNDRNDLWQILVLITARKAYDLLQHENRQKRGGDSLITLAPEEAEKATVNDALDQIIGPEPTPEFAAQVAEECQRLLDLLTDPETRTVAVWKMEGYTTEEIAEKLDCVPRTVERKLRVIRSIWGQRESS
jgi:DNA-directed RNA polymerase specialized sigma24 family protein